MVRALEIEAEARKEHPEDYAKMAQEIDAENAVRDKAGAKPAEKGGR